MQRLAADGMLPTALPSTTIDNPSTDGQLLPTRATVTLATSFCGSATMAVSNRLNLHVPDNVPASPHHVPSLVAILPNPLTAPPCVLQSLRFINAASPVLPSA